MLDKDTTSVRRVVLEEAGEVERGQFRSGGGTEVVRVVLDKSVSPGRKITES